ncbi:MAG: ABC transporter permease [Thermomicrobiales bacterium]|nr:ABC transporter permease [Thermomicrobiales bacterium]
MTHRSRRAIEITLTFAAPLLILLLWELLSRTERIDPKFWPPPTSLWETARDLVVEGDLIGDIWASLIRILGGFLLGAVPGVILGLAMGLFWPVRVFFMPIATAIYAVPKIAILPLVIIAFGIGEASKMVVVALSIFFLVVLNTMSGVMTIDRTYQDVARNFGANRWQLFLTVALPGALPAIFTGLKLALGFSLIVIVGTEFLAARSGVGHLIWQSWQTLAIKKMYVGLIVTGLMGWALTLGLDAIERLVLPWNDGR